jgi:hypothetical protein
MTVATGWSDGPRIQARAFIASSAPASSTATARSRRAQNLRGNWESSKFNLSASLVEAIPQIGEHDTAIVIRNDGLVQGCVTSRSCRT